MFNMKKKPKKKPQKKRKRINQDTLIKTAVVGWNIYKAYKKAKR